MTFGDVGRDLHTLDARNEELHVVDFVQLPLRQAGAVTGESVLFEKERTSVLRRISRELVANVFVRAERRKRKRELDYILVLRVDFF